MTAAQTSVHLCSMNELELQVVRYILSALKYTNICCSGPLLQEREEDVVRMRVCSRSMVYELFVQLVTGAGCVCYPVQSCNMPFHN